MLDDDWVVRKLAQIRRRSRSIDSAMPTMPTTGAYLPKNPRSTSAGDDGAQNPPDSENAPVRIGGLVTLQPLPQRATTSTESGHAERGNQAATPPLPSGGDRLPQPFPLPSERRSEGGNGETGEAAEVAGCEGAISAVLTGSGSFSPGGSTAGDGREGRKAAGRMTMKKSVEGDDEDAAGAPVAEGDRSRSVGSAITTVVGIPEQEHTPPRGGAEESALSLDTNGFTAGDEPRRSSWQDRAERHAQSGPQQAPPSPEVNEQDEEGQPCLREVTPEERALSLPNSSLLAADGSSDLGLSGRSVRWSGGNTEGPKNGKESVWTKR